MSEPYASGAFVTDGGLETDLIFHHGLDLPHFAAFPLVESDQGRELLAGYYEGYAGVARRVGAGLVLETPTWRANPDWAARLDYDKVALDRVVRASVDFMSRVRDAHPELHDAGVVVSGVVGPRGDGYVAESVGSAEDYTDYQTRRSPPSPRPAPTSSPP